MRTIAEIKENITADFMNNESAAGVYGFTRGDSFTAHFSIVSIESVLFYLFACAVWVLENLFEAHKKEVTDRIEAILPHRPKWYRDKVLAFMKDKTLTTDTDKYDVSDMNDADIEAARVIRHAVAVENSDASILTIKVAGETGGVRCKLDDETERQIAAYIAEIKDAGVRINLVNIEPDTFNCAIDVYYNPMLVAGNVKESCQAAIKSYIENLPFNGEYTNMSLVDAVQAVEGVKIVEFRKATTSASGISTVAEINARYIPVAGYFKTGSITINMIAYNE